MRATTMDLSIVLCTWNNCRRLAQTLDAIGRCAVPQRLNWETWPPLHLFADENLGHLWARSIRAVADISPRDVITALATRVNDTTAGPITPN
jgi:hypothetical protein